MPISSATRRIKGGREFARGLRGAEQYRNAGRVNHDDESRRGPARWIGEHMAVFIGVLGLIAWFVMLWLMFGDVL